MSGSSDSDSEEINGLSSFSTSQDPPVRHCPHQIKKKSSGRSSSEVALSKVPASSVVKFWKQLHLHTLTVHPPLAAQDHFWQGRFLQEQPFTMFLGYVQRVSVSSTSFIVMSPPLDFTQPFSTTCLSNSARLLMPMMFLQQSNHQTGTTVLQFQDRCQWDC